MKPPQYYSRYAETLASRGNLPHWSQRCATFVTFRLADSLPAEKLTTWMAERDAWEMAHPQPWNEATESEYQELFPARMQKWLDAGYGSCILRDDGIRGVVEASLRHFDDERYSLYAYVVMPNHVHALFMPDEGYDGRGIVQGWKSYTAKEINRWTGSEGVVWQRESYDHLVRNPEEFDRIRRYIRSNDPLKAFDAYGVNP